MERVAKEWDGQISIHAPVKGATEFFSGLWTTISISIHAPVKGATLRPDRFHTLRNLFQSTPP